MVYASMYVRHVKTTKISQHLFYLEWGAVSACLYVCLLTYLINHLSIAQISILL